MSNFKFGNAVVVKDSEEMTGVYLVFGRNQEDIAMGRIGILDQLNLVSVPESDLRLATGEEERMGERVDSDNLDELMGEPSSD